MQIIVRGKNLAVTPQLHDYAVKKFSRVEKYFHNIQEVLVELEVLHQKNLARNQAAHITLWAKGTVLRAEEASVDLHAAIDLAFEKIERQIKKYKEKIIDTVHQKKTPRQLAGPKRKAVVPDLPEIVEIKAASPKPKSLDEALLETKALGARFFVFLNSETNQFSVIYKIKDNQFGLIQPAV